MNACDSCKKVVDKVARTKNRWLCIDCMSDLVREAEILVATTTNLCDLLEGQNKFLRGQLQELEMKLEVLCQTEEEKKLAD